MSIPNDPGRSRRTQRPLPPFEDSAQRRLKDALDHAESLESKEPRDRPATNREDTPDDDSFHQTLPPDSEEGGPSPEAQRKREEFRKAFIVRMRAVGASSLLIHPSGEVSGTASKEDSAKD